MYRKSAPNFKEQISAKNTGLVLIDYQPEFVEPNSSTAVRNAIQLYQTAQELSLPVTVTTLASENSSGALLPEFEEHIVGGEVVQRQAINAWSVAQVRRNVEGTSKTKVVLAGGLADVSLTATSLSCLRENYDVYVVWDACITSHPQTLDITLTRLVQAGIIPITTQAVIAELTEKVPPWLMLRTPVLTMPEMVMA